MTIQDWGAIGEIVGAIGVIATLLYLALEIRKNTVATRQQTSHDIVNRHGDWYEAVSGDRDRMRIFMAGIAGHELDQIDSQRFTMNMLKFMLHFQDLQQQYEAGIVEESLWKSQCSMLGALIEQPGFKSWWREAQQYFAPGLVALTNEIKPMDLVMFDEISKDWLRPGGEFKPDEQSAT